MRACQSVPRAQGNTSQATAAVHKDSSCRERLPENQSVHPVLSVMGYAGFHQKKRNRSFVTTESRSRRAETAPQHATREMQRAPLPSLRFHANQDRVQGRGNEQKTNRGGKQQSHRLPVKPVLDLWGTSSSKLHLPL
ncbi:hypothetical protein MRX96_020423 [Rhipicephalus microplus]